MRLNFSLEQARKYLIGELDLKEFILNELDSQSYVPCNRDIIYTINSSTLSAELEPLPHERTPRFLLNPSVPIAIKLNEGRVLDTTTSSNAAIKSTNYFYDENQKEITVHLQVEYEVPRLRLFSGEDAVAIYSSNSYYISSIIPTEDISLSNGDTLNANEVQTIRNIRKQEGFLEILFEGKDSGFRINIENSLRAFYPLLYLSRSFSTLTVKYIYIYDLKSNSLAQDQKSLITPTIADHGLRLPSYSDTYIYSYHISENADFRIIADNIKSRYY